MKALIATDGSEQAALALAAASRVVRRNGEPVDLLCVVPEFQLPAFKSHEAKKRGLQLREKYLNQIEPETKKILDVAAESLRREGLETRGRLEIGSPAAVIVRLSEQYDLTVVGAKGKADQTRFGLGPVASRVAERAPGALLIGRELTSEKNLRILVGLDGSSASKKALDVMASCLNLTDAEITLMQVVETPWIHLGLEDEWFSFPEDVEDKPDIASNLDREMRQEAQELVLEARKRLTGSGITFETIIAEGNPATEILGQAEVGEYDLVVIGASGVTDVKHNVLGSVSAKVAWAAPCSVLIVRE